MVINNIEPSNVEFFGVFAKFGRQRSEEAEVRQRLSDRGRGVSRQRPIELHSVRILVRPCFFAQKSVFLNLRQRSEMFVPNLMREKCVATKCFK